MSLITYDMSLSARDWQIRTAGVVPRGGTQQRLQLCAIARRIDSIRAI